VQPVSFQTHPWLDELSWHRRRKMRLRSITKLGGAIFCDRRYDHVFVYHNGADSYYAARAFPGALKV
jgi:Protein of unknown function (DUF4256)